LWEEYFLYKKLLERKSPVYKSNQFSKMIDVVCYQIRDDYSLNQVNLKQEEEKEKLSHLWRVQPVLSQTNPKNWGPW